MVDNPWGTVPSDDSIEHINDDCTLPPGVYCLEYDLCDDCGDESDRIQNMCQHIALRESTIARAEWKAKAEKYRLRAADYECDLVRNEGECRCFTIPPKTCVRDNRMCQAVLKAVDGDE